MKNILSFKEGTPFLGKEIKEWINYNIENKTSHSKIACHMSKFLNILDNELYCIELKSKGTSCGEIKKYPIIVKFLCKERNCSTCEYSYLKDFSFEEDSFGDYAYICRKDNHYIGYPDEANLEICINYKEE